MNHPPVVLERSFQVPADQVWKALTDNNLMKQWYFDIENFKAEAGFEFQFYGGHDEKKYIHICRITEVVSGKKLVYSWRYEGYVGESLVSFQLFAAGNTTRLKLIHEGLETFPADNPDFAKANFNEGWNQIIGTNLYNFIENL